jgi:hypothetical protein
MRSLKAPLDDYPVTLKLSPHMILTQEHATSLNVNPLILIKTRSTKKLQAIFDFMQERLKVKEPENLDIKFKE